MRAHREIQLRILVDRPFQLAPGRGCQRRLRQDRVGQIRKMSVVCVDEMGCARNAGVNQRLGLERELIFPVRQTLQEVRANLLEIIPSPHGPGPQSTPGQASRNSVFLCDAEEQW